MLQILFECEASKFTIDYYVFRHYNRLYFHNFIYLIKFKNILMQFDNFKNLKLDFYYANFLLNSPTGFMPTNYYTFLLILCILESTLIKIIQ